MIAILGENMEILNPSKLNINFVSKFKTFTALATIFCLVSIFLLFKPGLNYGIDFRGGIEAHVIFQNEDVTPKMLYDLLSDKTKNLSIVEVENKKQNEYLLTIQEDDVNAFAGLLTETLRNKYGDNAQILQLDSVGPKVGSDLKKSALLSIFYTCLLICVYLYIRFDLRYVPGALGFTAHKNGCFSLMAPNGDDLRIDISFDSIL